jgi:hypothetical protein
MDETSGGTMTPPRDEDANSGDFAPVIPLRRRQQDPEAAAPIEKIEPDSRGIWDPDTPIADLTERPSLREQPTATEPLVRPSATVGEVEVSGGGATTVTRHHRTGSRRLTRRRLAQLTVACGVLATTAVVVALAGGGRPGATHAATTASTRVPRRTVTHIGAKTRPNAHTHGVAARTAGRPRTVARHSRKRPARHATLTISEHPSQSVVAVRAPSPDTRATARTTPLQHARAPAGVPATISSSGVSSCVPGELGC